MDCDGLRKVLFDHVDGLLGREEADAARGHLADCGPCRALQEEVRRNFSALDAWEEEDLPTGAFDRLRARLPAPGVPGGPRPFVEIGADASAGTAAAVRPHRRWRRLALPYAAGLVTAAAAAGVLVLSLPGVGGPGAVGPGGNAPAPSVGVPAPVPGVRPTAAVETRPGGLRPGERKLEFRDLMIRDVERGVLRSVRLPTDVDPAKLELLPDAPRSYPDDEGVK